MQNLLVVGFALLALVRADECPSGGLCEDNHTCCQDPASGYGCCPSQKAECCGDHIHCCPEGMLCMVKESRCANATVSVPWMERLPAKPSAHLKSFRMIQSYMGRDDDIICPDQSRCPSEFSCLMTFTKFGCCPLAQGIPCSDGMHCCPKNHQCSNNSRSCIKSKEPAEALLCGNGEYECPAGASCCKTSEGIWECCPMAKAVCCDDKTHCCPEGSTCDVKQSKCISSSEKILPMWAKFPARKRAEWEKESSEIPAKVISENHHPGNVSCNTTAKNSTPSKDEQVSSSLITKGKGNEVPCNDTVACEDETTCCKTKEGEWACCPLPEAVCCEDFIHCCPHGMKCNVAAETCEDPSRSVPWLEKKPVKLRQKKKVDSVMCDANNDCPLGSTCCKTASDGWACCPLTEAVCCGDHKHCCPKNSTCDLATLSCHSSSGIVAMKEKVSAFTTAAPDKAKAPTQIQVKTTKAMELQSGGKEENDGYDLNWDVQLDEEEEGEPIQCDAYTACPSHTTCCFMASAQKWGCCPIPDAVCCSDGEHCCPAEYKCDVTSTTCSKGEVEIPWYNKLPALESDVSVPSFIECDKQTRCPVDSTCCRLLNGQWGCCPLQKAVCCPDQEHCCPQGYSCNMGSASCQRLILLQLQRVPLTRLFVPMSQPGSLDTRGNTVLCEFDLSCKDGETCCKTAPTTWGCCPSPNAVCCSDMKHCCPAGYTCGEEGSCTQNTGLSWDSWRMFFSSRKRVHV